MFINQQCIFRNCLSKYYHHCKYARRIHKSCKYLCPSRQKSGETKLLKQLQAKIKLNGPLTVAEYMREVLTNPVAGYYMHQDVFGQKGDFITSPEISQMFGELLGIWCIHEWQQSGSPGQMQVVELGPGRGTLADDILRVFSQFPSVKEAASVHLVEVSPHLSQMQADKLTGGKSSKVADTVQNQPQKNETETHEHSVKSQPYKHCISKYGPPVSWYHSLQAVPRGFTIHVAHEFFDALPIHKFQKQHGKWHEVLVDVDDSPEGAHHLRYVLSPGKTTAMAMLLQPPPDSKEHIEVCPEGGAVVQELAARVSEDGGLALIADYGHTGEKTDTFRGFKSHQLHDPLCEPGSADLTADVDFSYLRNLVKDKVSTYGPVTQQHFLLNMGIHQRLQVLYGKADERQRKDLISGYDLLTNPEKMGERFKFFALGPKRDDYIPAAFNAT